MPDIDTAAARASAERAAKILDQIGSDWDELDLEGDHPSASRIDSGLIDLKSALQSTISALGGEE